VNGVRPQLLARYALMGLGVVAAAWVIAYVISHVVPASTQPTPLETPDPLRRTHEILKRIDQAYPLRIQSIKEIRASGLAMGNPSTVEDEILTAALALIREHKLEGAVTIATRKVTGLAPRMTTACAKAGIVLGPSITPELIRVRISNSASQKLFAQLLEEYQFSECVRALLSAHWLAQKPEGND